MSGLNVVAELRALGAVIKPFAVKSIGFSGLVVRLDADQRRDDGLVTADVAALLKALCSSSPVLLELRGARLEDDDVEWILPLTRLAGLDLAGASGDYRLLAKLSVLVKLVILDLSLRPCNSAAIDSILKLPNLSRLCLSRAELDDAAVNALATKTRLKELFIDHHRASPAAIARLRAALPECRITD